MLSVSQLFIYPVKSMAGIGLSRSRVTDRGLEHDRRWMLIDDDNRFLSQRELPQLALFQPSIINNTLNIVCKPAGETISLPLQPTGGEPITVTVWDDTCMACLVDAGTDAWFSRLLGLKCRLVYMPDSSLRPVDPGYAPPGTVNSLSDAYPFLMISQASIDDLTRRAGKIIPSDRFRPNIIVSGAEPYAEDSFAEFMISSIPFSGVKLCARCPLPGIDQQTLEVEKEPLRTLSGYRRKTNKVWFGQNLIHNGEGLIFVGDEIEVLKYKEAALFDFA